VFAQVVEFPTHTRINKD